MASPSLFVRLFAAAAACACAAPLSAQVFVVGEKTATADIAADFTPTRVDLPSAPLNERDRRDLIRTLVAEQGFAHRALPLGSGLTLIANGHITPGGDAYRKMIYEKGESAAPGDRVVVTGLYIRPDRIVVDLNGGPYEKHRYLSHIQINGNNVVQQSPDKASGARITLVFEHEVPDISAPEVKSLLEPVIDFGVKSSEQAYADTLPAPLKEAIAAHDVLVGMNKRMVIAALGAPESKMRERDAADPNGQRYEEWIYGHQPETVRFVRFQGDRVSQIEVAELGKPIQIFDKPEMDGLRQRPETREVAMGDAQPATGEQASKAPPTLRNPGETAPMAGGQGRVQYPQQPPNPIPALPPAQNGTPAPNPDATSNPQLP